MTCALLTVVLGAVLNFLTTTQRIAPKDVERNHALGEAQVGLHRMTRELRQGKPPVGAPLPSAPTNSIDVVVGSVRVRYACDVASSLSGFRRCVRYASSDLTTAPGGAGATVIDRVANGSAADSVFYPSASGATTNYFRAKLVVPARGELKPRQGYSYSISLNDGFYMRNAG